MYELKENERWVKGYEGRYFVNTGSEVWSLVKGIPNKLIGGVIHSTERNISTYRIMCLTHYDGVSESKYLHRIVAEAFIPNPEGKPTVNHINGKKQDNRIENLEWATWKEQAKHAHTELPRKDRQICTLMSDESVRNDIMDCYLRYGVEKVSRLYLERYIKEQDFVRNGIPYELYKTTGIKCKSYLDKWVLLLVLGCCLDSNKSLVEITNVTGIHNTLVCRVKSGKRFSNLMEIYHKYKCVPQYVDKHIAKISLTYNGNYKDM